MKSALLKHIIHPHESVRDALIKLNDLRSDAILFVASEELRLIGTLTDGDLRRGFIKGLDFNTPLMEYVMPDSPFIYDHEQHRIDAAELKKKHLLVMPIINKDRVITNIINLRTHYSALPADVVIMAGGKGQRLMPLTKKTPKPMLHVGDKPILEHNIDRLIKFGIRNIHVSVNYLADSIKTYFGDGADRNISISYIEECRPMGTMGSVKLAQELEHDYVLVMNSDILTDIDYAAFFKAFIDSDADMAVATTSYKVEVPYGVLEVDGENMVNALREKPSYSYQSNAGIYLAKKELLMMVPDGDFYDVTDLMDALLSTGKKLLSYPILGYWRDIGNPDDLQQAQEDIKFISF